MDTIGWHERRRALKEAQLQGLPQRGPDGQYRPIEQVLPLNEDFIGGFAPLNISETKRSRNPGSPVTPITPPFRDESLYLHYTDTQSSVDEGYYSRQPSTSPTYSASPTYSTVQTKELPSLPKLTAIERSQGSRTIRMHPHLQFMAGPLLRYDTVDEEGVWNGACLIITADVGSTYDPHPRLIYEWDPDEPVEYTTSVSTGQTDITYELSPHPADPHSQMPLEGHRHLHTGPNRKFTQVLGEELWVYRGNGGTFTFWRFFIRIPLEDQEMSVKYCINNGLQMNFHVPGRDQNMRWAAYSCNGFSAGVNADNFRGPGFQSGYDPVWMDMLQKHSETPFHVLVGGGDQIYCDGLTREPEFQDWINTANSKVKLSYPLKPEIAKAIDRFYFNHYCQVFRSGAFARANSSIPMANMADDHDLIDGFGSYPDDLQRSPVFQAIGSRGYFFFLLFQCFINVEIDGIDDRKHPFRSLIIGGPGAYVPCPSHSFLIYLGPSCRLLLLDCRAERTKKQVCSAREYQKVFRGLNTMPPTVKHVVVLTGIPIAYPRMVFLERFLGSKFNPLVALAKGGSLKSSGFVNKFNADAELLDDLNDHWTAKSHKHERNWLVSQFQNLALQMHVRVTFLSGDVHCAAVGLFKTFGGNKDYHTPEFDHRYMINVVTSAIVNTPPPAAVLSMVSTLSTKVHKSMHRQSTDEIMMPIFKRDTNGTSPKSKYIMGRRNWCSVRFDNVSGCVVFDIRVEKDKGCGVTVGYEVNAPPPRWSITTGVV